METIKQVQLHELAMLLDSVNRTENSKLKTETVEFILHLINDSLNK